MSSLSPVCLLPVCGQWSSGSVRPHIPLGLLTYTETSSERTSRKYSTLSVTPPTLLMTFARDILAAFFLSRLVKFHYAKPTISFNMHVSREPQDDGYTVLAAQESRVPERSLSEKSLTLESSSDVSKRMKSPKQVGENSSFTPR